MPLIGLSFFFLGLVVASVTANTTEKGITTTSAELGQNSSNPTIVTPLYTTTGISRTINMPAVTVGSTMNITEGNSTIPPSTTKQNSNEGLSNASQSTMAPRTTPKPLETSKSTISTTKPSQHTNKPNATPRVASDFTGIIILVVIILVAVGFGVACYVSRRRGRRYSVDFNSRPDDANIPLSTIEPELPIDSTPQNGLQTFESTETTTKEPQEPEAKPEVQEEQKAETDKSAVDPSAESAAPASSPVSPEDKPKEAVVEPSPPAAPVEPSVEEKTDDESVVSNKTSVESLKESNENNSNNADVGQKRDLKRSTTFWDVPLDCPV
ncbi:mucin-2 isoform X2 [Plectropomus leopardus]|uniref:mucin-2 isoform X2 n=1 Tax=Plectropomus leopardus TaxID=160734 RepID=UPI001C4D71A0|nr:mucin-2 isoform X2 [Plectropomus leopardus]